MCLEALASAIPWPGSRHAPLQTPICPTKPSSCCPLEEDACQVLFAPKVSHPPHLLSPPTVEPSLAHPHYLCPFPWWVLTKTNHS